MLVDTKCPNCGAAIQFDNNRSTMFCPFCGSQVSKETVDNTNKPNLFISFNTTDPSITMETRITSVGAVNTYTNGQSKSFCLIPGHQTVQLKIGEETYGKNIEIPSAGDPVMLYASYNGKSQVFVHQPNGSSANSNETYHRVETNNDTQHAEPSQDFSSNASNTNIPVSPINKPKNKIITLYAIAAIAILIVSIAIIAAVISNNRKGTTINPAESVAGHKLYLEIKSEYNLFFSQYDISILLDGEELGTVSNGKLFTKLVEASEGKHELTFCKTGSSSPKKSREITISGDMTYACTLAHGTGSIDIQDEKQSDNVSGSDLEVIDVVGIHLSDAMNKLEKIGFVNVREEPYGNIWDKDNWIVVSQSATPGSHIDKNEIITLNCVKESEYFESLYKGKTINECETIHEGAWYILKYFDSSSSVQLDISFMNNNTKSEWIVVSVEYDKTGKEVRLSVKNDSKPQESNSGNTSVPSETSTSEPVSTTKQKTITEQTTTTKPESVYYSTNDKESVREGKKGVYAYSSTGPNYEIYLVIDLDKGYVYRFLEGNGDATCDRVKIVSGDLNDKVIITYKDGKKKWSYGIHFAWKGRPEHLIWQDQDGTETSFYPTDLKKALALRAKKKIIKY